MKRFRITDQGYKFDKLIFFGIFVMVLSLVLFVMYSNEFNFDLHPYVICTGETCKNPYYDLIDCKQTLKILWSIPIYTTKDCRIDCDWCNQEFLTYGEYGTKPKNGFLLNNLAWIGILLMFFGLLMNHILHNKGNKFDIEIPITEKIVINKRKLKDWFKENETNKDNKQD